MGTLSKGDFHVIAPWRGTDNYPMWRGDFIYFTSDREAGTMNLFKFNPRTSEVKAVTHYTDYDVKYPSAGPDSIVYQYGESSTSSTSRPSRAASWMSGCPATASRSVPTTSAARPTRAPSG